MIANPGDLAGLGAEHILLVIETPAAAAVQRGEMVTPLLSEVEPFFGNLADFAECRLICHQAVGASRAMAAQGHDERVHANSTDACSQKPVHDLQFGLMHRPK